MKLFSNRKQTSNELLSALAVLDGTLSQRLEGKENVSWSMDVVAVIALSDKACFHVQFKVVILAVKSKDSKVYTHDVLLMDDNVDSQINACLLAVTEQLSIAGL